MGGGVAQTFLQDISLGFPECSPADGLPALPVLPSSLPPSPQTE